MELSEETFEIFAGTYEEYMLGFKLSFDSDEKVHKLEQTVADHTHKGSIRTLTTRGDLLASGGFDEVIHVYNLDDNREIGTLSQHTGTVTCLTFTSDGKHLISCSEDGSIAIYRVGSWIMEKQWTKAHKGHHVNWIAVHPSDKMGFSVGNDGTLRTWNLIDGKPAFVTKISHLSNRPELVVWSPEGTTYAIPHSNELSVFSVEKAKVKHKFSAEAKITCCHYIEEGSIWVGDENGCLTEFNIKTGKSGRKEKIGDTRVKAMSSHNHCLVAATSQGLIVVYKIAESGLVKLAKADSMCRVTCLAISCHCHRLEKGQDKNKKIKGSNAVKQEENGENVHEEKEEEKKEKLVNFGKNKVVKSNGATKSPALKRRKSDVVLSKRISWDVEEQQV